MKKLCPPKSVATLDRSKKNLIEILSPSLFPPKFNKNESSTSSCNKCDICKNYLISDTKLMCTVTGRMYNV